MAKGKHEAPKKRPFFKHMASIGFTNRMATYLIALLAVGLAGGFVLAVLSIKYQYTGALACWTVVFTPIGTACSIVLHKIVSKSENENTSADGDGIKYATAMKQMEMDATGSENSPAI